MNHTPQERATIVAALIWWQGRKTTDKTGVVRVPHEVKHCFDLCPPLNKEQTEELIERLSHEGEIPYTKDQTYAR